MTNIARHILPKVTLAAVASLVVACSGGGGDPAAPSDGGAPAADDGAAPAGEAGSPLPRADGGAPERGVATYYDATGAGNCSFDATPNDLDVAAMDDPEWAGSAVCGACARVLGPKGEVTVRIVDRCPGCEKGHLDLSQEAFAKIADLSAGRVAITWQIVPCDVTGPLAYHYKDGTSPYWTAIQVRNSRLEIQKLEIQKAGAFVGVARADYNYFVDPSGAGTGPVHVRVTAVDGQVLEDTLPPPSTNATSSGASQFR